MRKRFLILWDCRRRLGVYSFMRLFVYSFIRLFVYSFIRLFVYAFICLFVLFVYKNSNKNNYLAIFNQTFSVGNNINIYSTPCRGC